MEIMRFRGDNPDAKHKADAIALITENLTRIDTVLKYLEKLRPELEAEYTSALSKRIQGDIVDFQIDYSELELDELKSKLLNLSSYSELQNLIILQTFFHLKLSKDFRVSSEEFEANLIDWIRSTNILKYNRVKAFVDILEREEGIQLWKDLLFLATDESLNSFEEEIHPPIKEITEGWIKAGQDKDSLADLTIVKYDDYKVALRFDRCPVYESTKHLVDPEVAFLSWCGTGFPEEELNKRTRRKRTPQTLHDSDYCIEFYWNNEVHPDAEPPTSEFWTSIKKERGE